jgi:PAS domain S-box-containing protein
LFTASPDKYQQLLTENAALRETQQLLQSTLDALPLHIAILDHSGTIIGVNAAWRRFAAANGYDDPSYGVGINYLALCEAASGEEEDVELSRAVARGIREVMAHQREAFELEYPCHNPTQQQWFIARVNRLADGGLGKVVVAHENLTLFKQAERRLQTAERQQQAMLDTLPDLFWLKDSDGRYQIVNRAFCEFHGLLREEVVGKTADELFAPAIVAGIRTGDRTIMEQGGVTRNIVRTYNSGVAAGWVETTKGLVYDQQGVLLGIVGMTRDITERKLLEEKVRASEEKLRTLFEILPVGVAITDEQHQIVEMNPALGQILDLSFDKLMSGAQQERTYLRPDGKPMLPEDAPSARALAEQRAIYQNEIGVIKEDGTTIWTSVSAAPLPIAGLGTAIVTADITERKRAEEQRLLFERRLLETQRLESLGVLAGGVAHDFNNLLSSILGYAELALQELPVETTARSDIKAVISAAYDAAQLTNLMLAYSGKGHFVIQPIYLDTLIQETNELLEASLAKNCVVRYRFADQLPPIEADIRQLRQVILNVLTNAAEAIDATGGTITLATTVEYLTREALDSLMFGTNLAPGDYVRLTVIDTGHGMDEKTLTHIFDPFFTTKFTGRGLGLAAVQGIVRGHRGALSVSSAPRQGTVFSIWFPALGAPSMSMPAADNDLRNIHDHK